jgi:hypothetical protein
MRPRMYGPRIMMSSFGKALAPDLAPLKQGVKLRLHSLHRGRRVNVRHPLMAALPERSPGSLAGLGRRKEKKEEIIKRRNRIAGDLEDARIVATFACTRPGSKKHQTANELRMEERKCLRDVSTDREAEHVDFGETKSIHEGGSMIGHGIDSAGSFAARAGHARIVKEDDRSIPGKTVSEKRIPVVHSAAEMLQEQKRDARVGAEAPIGVA